MLNIKKHIAVWLVFVLVLSAMPTAFAAKIFTDLADDHWAAQYILKVSEHEIMTGYADATFKPTQPVSKLEVITALYNAIVASGKFTRAQGAGLAFTHEQALDEAQIPATMEPYGSAVREAAAYALENNILHPDELKGFVVDGEFTEATRLESTVFIGKGLNLFLRESTLKIISFKYKDQVAITQAAAPYVDLLITYDIISGDGDANGNFNPKIVIGRDVLATMIAKSFDILEGNTKPTDTGSTLQPVVSDKVYEASVALVHNTIGLIELRDGGGKLKVYDATRAQYLLNGVTVSLSNLVKGMDVTVYESAGKLDKIVINKQFDKEEGTFDKVSGDLKDDLGSFTVMTMVKADGSKKYYKIYDSILLTRDGESATINTLVKGDKVMISAEEFIAREVEAYSKQSTLSGILNRSTDFKKGSSLSVQLQNGRFMDEVLATDIQVVEQNGDIRKGDIIKVTLEYGKIVQVEATGMSSELSGEVVEIIIAATPKVKVKEENGSLKTVSLNSNYVVTKQGESQNFDVYALRLNQQVTMKLDAFGANSISVNKTVEKVKFTAEVMEVHKSTNLLKVKDDGGKQWVVGVKDGSALNILDYAIGDKVFVYGIELSDSLFEAEMIIQMN